MISDVFLSYAREARERAGTIAFAIEAQGWSVWWDPKIVAGQAFDHAIEPQLETAGAVVVLWSTHSVASEWVRNEAALASEREALVPVLIVDVKQPLEFRRRQAANLTTWTGDTIDSEFQRCTTGSRRNADLQAPGLRRVEPARWSSADAVRQEGAVR